LMKRKTGEYQRKMVLDGGAPAGRREERSRAALLKNR